MKYQDNTLLDLLNSSYPTKPKFNETKMAEQSAEHFTHFTTNYCLKT